jgi:3-hydroxyacyl-CoA dehydrogenase
MSDTVIHAEDRADGVRVLTVENPPVNAISSAVRQQLKDAIEAAGGDGAVKAVVVTGAGNTFIAGADIREFGKTPPPGTPTLPDVVHALEDCPKTVVCAINGAAAGGGLEIAMGCHWRIAAPKAPVGLPEVNLGIIPGATGCLRLPRAVGVEKALDLIVEAKLIPAPKAEALGMIDAVTSGDLIQAAAAMALDRKPRKLREDDSKIEGVDPALFETYKKGMARKYRGFTAPFEAVDVVRKATELPYDEALEIEREAFIRLRESAQSKAMRHVFFAEREVARVPGIPKDTQANKVEKAAIIGCGTMGGGIAMNFANAGIPVTVLEMKQEALERGIGLIEKNYAATVSKGRMAQADMDKRMGLIRGTTSFDDLGDADIIIEAVFEDMGIKKEVFAKLDAVAKPGAVLATNTSTLDIDEIATAVKRPEAVVGTHFFSPANVMRLLENVRAEKTSPEVAQTVMKLAPRIGKVGVMVGVCDGFVGNRMLYAYTRQANFMLEEGALPAQIDKVIYEFGMPMGPFAMGDLAGIDVGYLVRQERLKSKGPSGKRESVLGDKVYEMGRMGQKNGKGWYDYEAGNRVPQPSDAVNDMIVAASKELGIARRDISDTEILERCLYPLVNEGAKLLQEGIAARSLDIDLIWIHGYGFPRYRGGPMFWADSIGLQEVLSRLTYYRDTFDSEWLEPAPLLVDLAKAGKGFGDFTAG